MKKKKRRGRRAGRPLITGYGTRIFAAPLVFKGDRIGVYFTGL
jgi:hypothetical protein